MIVNCFFNLSPPSSLNAFTHFQLIQFCAVFIGNDHSISKRAAGDEVYITLVVDVPTVRYVCICFAAVSSVMIRKSFITATGRDVLDLFVELNKQGHTIVMITHDLNVAKSARRIVKIIDGEIFE